MTTYVGATEAARLLGVTKPTLYAYVSRGLVDRQTAVDGRTSLYDREQLQRLAVERSGRRRPIERPSIDVQVGSAVTELRDDGVCYRGHDLVELATTRTFEEVAELLWTGELPSEPPRWRVDRTARSLARSAASLADDPSLALALAAATQTGPSDSGADAARRLLAVAPTVLGGPATGDMASRLAGAWVRRPAPELIAATNRALVLLADHELATSTLAVRVACSVRCDAADALATGLHVVRGRLHGAAGIGAHDLLVEAAEIGAAAAIGRRLDAGERIPGFGHTVYRHGDPRFGPLRDAVALIPGGSSRSAVLDAVVAEAGRAIGHLPNIDLAVGALGFVGGLPRDAPVFAVARIAGWGAHFDEERTERPLRYRGLAARR